MCDYSLEHLQSKKAERGMVLISSMFHNTITRGFSEVGGDMPVCLRPGTELAFERGIEYDHQLSFFPIKKTGHMTAIFRQVNKFVQHEHHDALEFPDGKIVLLARLCPGQRATVLQVPTDEAPAKPEIAPTDPLYAPSLPAEARGILLETIGD